MRTQVCIIGAGPAGLLLSQLLHINGITSIVLERRPRATVEARIRAGVLEAGTVALLHRAGVGHRLQAEGIPHAGFNIVLDAGDPFRIDLNAHTGGQGVTVYGQTEITKDLIEALTARQAPLLFEAADVALHDIDSQAPHITCTHADQPLRIDCDFIAGCDGYHGPSRAAIPASIRQEFERIYPFGWLGILADVPPCAHELIYANHERGFALASMRSPTRSRYYIQTTVDEDLANWPDARIWDEIACRIGPTPASTITRGPAIEKSIAPLRSFVAEPMRHGRLFLAGDAAHIVPPTGAKGLNLAAADVGRLAQALTAFYAHEDETQLHQYSTQALARVWKVERFSWWFTSITHRFPGMDPFARKMQRAELDYIRTSKAAQTSIAENYIGLPQQTP